MAVNINSPNSSYNLKKTFQRHSKNNCLTGWPNKKYIMGFSGSPKQVFRVKTPNKILILGLIVDQNYQVIAQIWAAVSIQQIFSIDMTQIFIKQVAL